jgi:hypothetical protein
MCKVPFLGNQPPMPTYQGVGRNKGIQGEQSFTSDCLSLSRQQRSFVTGP